MERWMKICLGSFLLVTLILLGLSAWAAPDLGKAKKQSAEMVEHAKAMVDHGEAGHLDVMTKHAKAMLDSAHKALDSMPPGNMHAESAADHIKLAIEHATAAIDRQSVERAREALDHAREGNKHAQQM